ncbi:hypothetical protein KGM_213515 [Danaus plexippus plexippus]|uniref:Uncharacterized protein n=1 Tax=Danaus plexippus plexippus TaxID=278856 RepID=A0A212F417_DANPL|nr:hypothetical protein KGM_213515 [Danaus plexippus plexippus]
MTTDDYNDRGLCRGKPVCSAEFLDYDYVSRDQTITGGGKQGKQQVSRCSERSAGECKRFWWGGGRRGGGGAAERGGGGPSRQAADERRLRRPAPTHTHTNTLTSSTQGTLD